MSKLSRDLRVSAKRGTSVPASVVDVFFGRASARLSNNGAIVRNLAVIGGPVEIGDTVMVDYTTPEPTIVAIGKEWLTQSDLDRALSRLPDTGSSGGIVLAVDLFVGGSLYKVYSADVQGLGQALTDAQDGDSIHYHNACLTMDAVVPSGVSLIGLDPVNCVIKGKITLGTDSYLQNIGVQYTVTSGSEIIGVEASGSGQAIIEDCHIYAINCGSGNVLGISCEDQSATLIVRDCMVYAEASSGSGHAIRGPAQVEHSRLYGSTDLYTGNVEVYSNYEKETPLPDFTCSVNCLSSAGQQLEMQDGVIEMSLDGLGTSGSAPTTLLNTNQTSNQMAPLRHGDYIYYCKNTFSGPSTTTWTIVERNLLTDEEISISEASTSYDWNPRYGFCTDCNRNVYIAAKTQTSPVKWGVVKIAFPSATASVLIHWEQSYQDAPYYWQYQGIQWITLVTTSGSQTLVCGEYVTEYIEAWEGNAWDDENYEYIRTHFVSLPGGGSTSSLDYAVSGVQSVNQLHMYMYAPVWFRTAQKLVYIYTFEVVHSAGGRLIVHVIDPAGTVSVNLYENLDTTYQTRCYNAAADDANSVLYAEIVQWNGFTRSLVTMDLSSMGGAPSILRTVSGGATVLPFCGYRDSVMRFIDTGTQGVYNGNGNLLFTASLGSYNVNGASDLSPMMMMLDDIHNYIWYYTFKNSNNYKKIVALNGSTGDYVRSFDIDVVDTDMEYSWLYPIGDVFLLELEEASSFPGSLKIYLIEE
jgi:hypothetical protein